MQASNRIVFGRAFRVTPESWGLRVARMPDPVAIE